MSLQLKVKMFLKYFLRVHTNGYCICYSHNMEEKDYDF